MRVNTIATSDGYIYDFVPSHPCANGNGYVARHRLVVERAIRHVLPQDSEVHHFDEVKNNNSSGNLVACDSHGYHMVMHKRQRVLAAGFDPRLYRRCTSCKTHHLIAEFGLNRAIFDGIANRCRTSDREYKQEWRRRIK